MINERPGAQHRPLRSPARSSAELTQEGTAPGGLDTLPASEETEETMTSGEYWNGLNFSYLKTFSFNRAPESVRNPTEARVRLTDQTGKLHSTAKLISSCTRQDKMAEELELILTVPVTEQHLWMCAPVYRDAIAFYDQEDKVVSVLNICFQCDSLLNQHEQRLDTDYSVFKRLRTLLTEVGHPIEDKETKIET